MTEFTVEATLTAVANADWSPLRSVTDLVPGTLLIEDPDEPVLVFPVEADSPTKAFLFVDGILKLAGLEPVSGTINPAPAVDFDGDEDTHEGSQTDAERAVNEWIERVPSFDGRVAEDGTVELV